MVIPTAKLNSTENGTVSIEKVYEAQNSASTYSEWLKYSEQLDVLRGVESWKAEDSSSLYDSAKLRRMLEELRCARLQRNVPKLLYLVRTTFSRNVANMGDSRLYHYAMSGTKHLIDDYILECEESLAFLANIPDEEASDVLNTLVQTRKAFGRTALVLSGGSILGFLHTGVLRELVENNLLPKIISGSSAGSIFASVVCIHREEEFSDMWKMLEVPMSIFGRYGDEDSFISHVKRFCATGTWIDNLFLKEMMQGLIGDMTFQEAYNRTGRILNVTVSVAGSHDMPRLLNYLTAPNVLIWSAVVCSCSVPFMFASDTIMAKDRKTKKIYPWTKVSFIDGSVDNDLPLGRLSEMFNVNHFVACQVNPHIAPILHRLNEEEDQADMEIAEADSNNTWGITDWVGRTASKVMRAGSSFVFSELEHSLMILKEAGICRSFASIMLNVIEQEYCGDITIVPSIFWHDVGHLFANPSTSQVLDLMQRGRQATWASMAIIRNHCAIELSLDKAIVDLRARIIRTKVPVKTRSRLETLSAPDIAPELNPYPSRSRSTTSLRKLSSISIPTGSAPQSPAGRRTSVDNLFPVSQSAAHYRSSSLSEKMP